MKLKHILYILIFTGILSCKKDDLEDLNEPIVEQNVSFLSHEIAALNCIKEIHMSGQQISFADSIFVFNTSTNSVIISKDTTSSLDSIKLKLNFGSQIALCNDGKFRSGIIEYTYKKNTLYCDSNNTVKIKISNYRVDTLLINGYQTIKNSGRVTDTLRWDINSSLVLTNNTGKSISFTGVHRIKLMNTNTAFISYQTPLKFNTSIFNLSGAASGTNVENLNYTSTLSNNIKYSLSCVADSNFIVNSQFTSGIVNYLSGGFISQKSSSINFGNEECDKKVTLKSQGYTLETTFR